jgi:branched-chain amino acid transport system permease protein
LITTILTGLETGALFALVAIGFNIVYIVTGTYNFAQAQYAMLGTVFAWLFFESLHLTIALTLALGALIGGVIGLLNDRLAIRFLPKGSTHGELVTTVGFSVILAGLATVFFGQNAQTVRSVLPHDDPMDFLGGRVFPHGLLLIVVAAAVVAGTEIVLVRTRVGLVSLATAEDRTAAILRGVNVRRLQMGAYMVAGALLVGLGPLIAPGTYATTGIGDELNIKAFVAMSLGGVGSPKGAAIGAVAAGLLQAFVGRYIGDQYQNIALFLMLLVVLMVRPFGIFGKREERAV